MSSYKDNEIRLQEVLVAYKQLEETSNAPKLRAWARSCKVSYKRLLARYNGMPSKLGNSNAQASLDIAQEHAICQYIDLRQRIQCPIRQRELRPLANSLLRKNDSTHPGVSTRWTARFLARHPQYNIKKHKTIAAERRGAMDFNTISRHFVAFNEAIINHGVQTADLYNVDESGFQLGMGRAQKVILNKLLKSGQNKDTIPNSANRESLTVVECISADGVVLAPLVIFAAKQIRAPWVSNDLGNETLLAVSDTGYINDDIALAWIKQFDKLSARRQVGAVRMLVLDGHTTHLGMEFVQYCEEQSIHLFLLPPHTTHILQPLDVGCFQPYKHYQSVILDEAALRSNLDFNKLDFLAALSIVRKQTFKPTNISSAWRRSGLYLYNPDLVLNALPKTGQPSRPNAFITPPRLESPSLDMTPTTVAQADQLAEYIIQRVQDKLLSSPFKNDLERFVKGSLSAFYTKERIEEDLHRNQSDALARATRKGLTNRVVQQGGVISVGQARLSVKKRQEDDVKQLEGQLKRARTKDYNKRRAVFKAAAAAARAKLKARTRWMRLMKVVFIDIRKGLRQ